MPLPIIPEPREDESLEEWRYHSSLHEYLLSIENTINQSFTGDQTVTVVTDVQLNGAVTEKKTRVLTFDQWGNLTTIGAESGWT